MKHKYTFVFIISLTLFSCGKKGEILLIRTPPLLTDSSDAVFEFKWTGDEDVIFFCTIDLSSAPCTSPVIYQNLGEGGHTFTVEAAREVLLKRGDIAYETIGFASYSWGIIKGLLWYKTYNISDYLGGDIDGDGRMDIVVRLEGGDVVALDGEDGTVLWHKEMSRDTVLSDIIDADGDGNQDIISFVEKWGKRSSIVLRGIDGALMWEYAGGAIYPFDDVNGDGGIDMIALSPKKDSVLLLNGKDGSKIWEYTPENTSSIYDMGPFKFDFRGSDIDGDGINDIILIRSDGYAIALNGKDGACMWVSAIPFYIPYIHYGGIDSRSGIMMSLDTGDVNGDGSKDVIGLSEDGLLILNGRDGSLLWHYPCEILSVPAVGDLDGDGIDEVVVGISEGTVALDVKARGFLWKNGEIARVALLTKDLDKDGGIEVIGLFGDLFLPLVLNGQNGTYKWEKGSCPISPFTVSSEDVNGDGRAEVFGIDFFDNKSFSICDGKEGTVLNEYSLPWHFIGIFAGDVNGDGKDEVIGITDKVLFVFSR